MVRCRSNQIKVLCLLSLTALLGLSPRAHASQVVPLEEVGLRYYPAQGEVCVTRDDVPPEALALLGADEAAIRAAMEHDQLYCIILTPQGTQVSLRIFDAPGDAFYANDSHGQQSSLPGFAFFRSTPDHMEKNPLLTTLSLCTQYLGKGYALQTDVFGRAPTFADEDILVSAAKRLLQLGAAKGPPQELVQENALALPKTAPLTDQMAPVAYQTDGPPLELSPIPAVLGTTLHEVSGITAPRASLKYTLNGRTSSRFQADENGRFTFTMKTLDPDMPNELTVIASQDGGVSTASCSLVIDWQFSPLALSRTTGTVTADHVILEGVTLPGSKVQLIRRNGNDLIPVDQDGRFHYRLALSKLGENNFTLRCLSSGYHRIDMPLSFFRTIGDSIELYTLRDRIKNVTFAQLMKKPSAYQGRTVRYRGTVAALANLEGQPLFLLTMDEGETIACLCPDLLDIHLGQEADLLGVLTGTMQSVESPWLSGEFPSLTLTSLIP